MPWVEEALMVFILKSTTDYGVSKSLPSWQTEPSKSIVIGLLSLLSSERKVFMIPISINFDYFQSMPRSGTHSFLSQRSLPTLTVSLEIGKDPSGGARRGN